MRWKLKRWVARTWNRPARSRLPNALGDMERLALILLAVALEVTPVAAGLQTAAAIEAGNPTMSALPVWFLVAITVLAAAVSARLRSHVAPIALAGVITLGGAATYLIALRVSPAAYAHVAATPELSLAWLTRIPPDLMSGSPRVAYALGLLAPVAYLWWRGVRLGSLDISYDRVFRVFQLGLAVIVMAVIATAALAGPARLAMDARLALILPLEVGLGLMGLALAHISDTITQYAPSTGTPDPGRLRPSRWLLTAVALAGAVVLGAFLLALALSYSTLLALAQTLSPIGAALDGILRWLVYALAFVLFLVFNGLIQWIAGFLRHQSHSTQQPQAPSAPHRPNTPLSHTSPPLSPEWIVAGQIAAGVILVIVVFVSAYLLIRALRDARAQPEETGLEETRESLDVWNSLGAQLRSLFTSRRASPRAQAGDDLAPSSVRHLYREVLRAALAAGRGRRSAETPTEYYQRWVGDASEQPGRVTQTPSDPQTRSALALLTQIYERARYGNTPEEGAGHDGAARSAARQVIAGLPRRQKPPKNRDG